MNSLQIAKNMAFRNFRMPTSLRKEVKVRQLFIFIFIVVNFSFTMTWTITRLTYDDLYSNNHSLALDSLGNVFIAYDKSLSITVGELHLINNATGSWVDTMLYDNPAGRDCFPSIVIDDRNNIHIAFTSNNELYYAKSQDGIWTIEEVPNNTSDDVYANLVLDSTRNALITYAIAISGGVHFVTNRSGSWQTEWFSSEGFFPTINLDGEGFVHIAYGTPLTYVTNQSGGWVEYPLGNGEVPSLFTDVNNHQHIAYKLNVEITKYQLWYGNNASGNWNFEMLTDSLHHIATPCMVIDRNNKVHIVYIRLGAPTNMRLFYITNSSGNWQEWSITPDTSTTIFEVYNQGYFRIDKSGYGHVVFHGYPNGSGTPSELYYARSDSPLVAIEEISSQPIFRAYLIAYPNPFLRNLTIRFQIPEEVISSQNSASSIRIYDASGRLIRQWDNETAPQSEYILWDATDNAGRKLPSGVYFVEAHLGEYKMSKGVVLLKYK